MKVRLLKVYDTTVNNSVVPQIRLQGKWLEKYGFKKDKKIIIEERYGELVLRIINFEEIR